MEGYQRVLELPDHVFWSMHQHLKSKMLHLVRHRIGIQHMRNQGSEAQLERLLRHANPDDPGVLTIELAPEFCGRLEYLIRAYPYHELLTHRFELGLMAWA